MTLDIITPFKKIKSFQIGEPGTHSLIQTDRAIMITDIIISKDNDERLVLKMSDGANEVPILFKDSAGIETIASSTGLVYWTGANLEVTTREGFNLITVGCVNVDSEKWEKWRQNE